LAEKDVRNVVVDRWLKEENLRRLVVLRKAGKVIKTTTPENINNVTET
jgi:hypothetical protein